MRTIPTDRDGVLLRLAEIMPSHGITDAEIRQLVTGDVTIGWRGVRCTIKPVIQGMRIEFSRPDWSWEIGCAYQDQPGAIVAGLALMMRLPKTA